MNCPLCQSLLLVTVDASYYQCSLCKAYVKDRQFYFNQEAEKKHYDMHRNDVEDLGYQKFTAPVTETVLHYFDTTSFGLDYGCGKGPVITHQLQKKGYTIQLFDPYFYPDESYQNYTYDYIFSCEVFEHFYEPAQEIEKLRSLLLPNGLLIIKTHLFDNQTDFKNWYYRKDATHVFIYTRETFEYIAKKFVFSIEKLEEQLIVLRKIDAI